jgi:hypothetical protein
VKHFLDLLAKDQEKEQQKRLDDEEDALLELFLSDDANAIDTLVMGGRRPAPRGPQGGVTREPRPPLSSRDEPLYRKATTKPRRASSGVGGLFVM